MTDWNPLVTKIVSIEKHPSANALEIAKVWDYPVAIKISQYKVGDLVGYLPIDTIVPDTQDFYFLCPKQYERYEEDGETKQRQVGMKYPVGSVPEKYRCIKAKRMMGVYSQGMLVDCPTGMSEGDSLIDVLCLKKKEEEEEENLPNMPRARGTNAEKAPDGWNIPYYDVQSLRKYLDCFLSNEEVVLLEKLHGSNSGFCHDGTRLWCKSRNFFKKFDPKDMWWEVAIRYDLENKLSKFPKMVFFAECVGQIKGFRYNSEVSQGKLLTKLYFFDVWDTQKMRYLDYKDSIAMIKNAGLDPVPELYKGPWLDKPTMYAYAEGMTCLGGKHIREGFVMKPLKERYEPKLDSRWQVKLVSETYNISK